MGSSVYVIFGSVAGAELLVLLLFVFVVFVIVVAVVVVVVVGTISFDLASKRWSTLFQGRFEIPLAPSNPTLG